MYQMICPVLEGFQAMEGLDASDGAGTGAEILMKFEEVYGRTRHGVLGQAEAAEILGVSERTFRRWRERYEADGAEGLYDRRLGRVLARRAPVDEVARVLGVCPIVCVSDAVGDIVSGLSALRPESDPRTGSQTAPLRRSIQ